MNDPQPTIPALQQPETAKPPVNAGIIVLQWLTYAFWGWTVLAMSVLSATIVANFLNDSDTGGFTPYGIAAVLVLLPISLVCDYFYGKHESDKKTGAETLVMVIHAVIFALFGIGALITAVFSVIQLMLDATNTDATITALVSALIVFVLYILTFVRTLNPRQLRWFQRWYKLVMLVFVGVIVVLGILGPVAEARLGRDDKLIENNLSTLSSNISSYTRQNKELPADLNALQPSGNVKEMLELHLVTYKPGQKLPAQSTVAMPESSNVSMKSIAPTTLEPVYSYELCATYRKATSGYNKYDNSGYEASEDGYTEYPNGYSHSAGKTCYKLKTSSY